MKAGSRNVGILIFFIFLGLLLGSLAGEILGDKFGSLKFLKTSYSIGTPTPVALDLKVFLLTIGMSIKINILSIIGVILAIILYKRY
ncbi:DUF4321 domain-containing protein [Clostridium folliculivorans]|uniref:Membrane protein n=1 Tax=Clostridium folliculivorans TaxID=2886038 RepID=A0A9W6D8C4_9CLOT|nr:DUF4321 domain-containing protein [Clostridium folliculivorans]GKU23384.1 membrane protein [Clostridium folliculivorans]GKU29501.1 membrane protein [Clostridium folliculivorans]